MSGRALVATKGGPHSASVDCRTLLVADCSGSIASRGEPGAAVPPPLVASETEFPFSQLEWRSSSASVRVDSQGALARPVATEVLLPVGWGAWGRASDSSHGARAPTWAGARVEGSRANTSRALVGESTAPVSPHRCWCGMGWAPPTLKWSLGRLPVRAVVQPMLAKGAISGWGSSGSRTTTRSLARVSATYKTRDDSAKGSEAWRCAR